MITDKKKSKTIKKYHSELLQYKIKSNMPISLIIKLHTFIHNGKPLDYEWLSRCRRPLYGTLNTWIDETDRREITNY